MRRDIFTGAALAAVAVAAFLGAPELKSIAAAQSAKAGAKPVLPVFEVDSHFPDMPEGLLLGGDIVTAINGAGGCAIGLTGKDGGLIRARRRSGPRFGVIGARSSSEGCSWRRRYSSTSSLESRPR